MVSQALWLKWPHHLQPGGAQRGHKWWARPCGWNDHTAYILMGHKEATNGEPGLVVEKSTPPTGWWGTKRPQMVSQASWLKWPHHLHTDGHKEATNDEPGLVVEWPHHLLPDGAQEATNGEPFLMVEITTPLTFWWGTKRTEMVSQALWLRWPHHLHTDGAQRGHKWWARPCGWNDHTTYILMEHKEATNGEPGPLKWPHHLLADGAQRGHKWWTRPCGWNDHTTYFLMGMKRPQMVSQALWLKGPHHLHTDGAQRGHKWWTRPCGWNDHTTYILMGHKEATNGEPFLVVEMTTPLTPWWGTHRPQMVSQALWLKRPHHLLPDGAQRGHKWWARPCGWNDHTTYSLMGHKEATNGEALWLKWPHHLHADGPQRGHKWWARPCGWNDHTTYKLVGHKEATNGEPGLVVEMTIPLTNWWSGHKWVLWLTFLWQKKMTI